MPLQVPTVPAGPVMNVAGQAASVEQGSQAYLIVGGKPIGYITDVTQNDNYGTQGFYALGTIMPLELQSLKWTGTLSVSGARAYTVGWQSQFMVPGSYILTQGLVSIGMWNRINKQFDAVFLHCAPASFGNTWAANAFTLQNGTWLYTDVWVPGYGLP